MFNSFLILQNLFSSSGLVNTSASWSLVPTLSIEMPLFVDDLLWNDDRHLYALFLSVEPGCWWALWHFHCHIAMALAQTWFHFPTKFLKSIAIVHNNYPRICTLPRSFLMQPNFASLRTMTLMIFQAIDMCPMYSFYPHCIQHNLSPSIQSIQIVTPWDTKLKSNTWYMLQIPQYSFHGLQMTFSW